MAVCALCAALAAGTEPASAVDAEFSDFGFSPTEVSVVTGTLGDTRTSPAVANVFTRDDIEASGAKSVEEVLMMVPGFHVTRGSNWHDYQMALRGSYRSFSETVMVMIDGIPQTNYSAGNRMLVAGLVPIDAIERIEVLRGPGSALYGSDAFAGTINIITARGDEAVNKARVEAGTQETGRVAVSGGTQLGPVKFSGALEYWQTKGDDPWIEEDTATFYDQLFGTSASYAPTPLPLSREEIGLIGNFELGETILQLRFSDVPKADPGTGNIDAVDLAGEYAHSTHQVHLKHTWQLTPSLDNKSWVSWTRVSSDGDSIQHLPPGTFGYPGGTMMDSKFHMDTTQVQSLFTLNLRAHTLVFGGGGEWVYLKNTEQKQNYFIEDGFPYPLDALVDVVDTWPLFGEVEKERNLWYLLAQDEWAINARWAMLLGVRYDQYSDVGSITSPRFGLVYDHSDKLVFKAMYGVGYQLPHAGTSSLAQIPGFVPNPNIHEERLENFELSMSYRPSARWNTQLTLFHDRVRDGVVVAETPVGVTYVNEGKERAYGGELEVGYYINRNWSLTGWYAFQETTQENLDVIAGYAPRHKVFAMLKGRSGAWSGALKVRGIFDVERPPLSVNTRKTDDYAIVDLFAKYRVNRTLAFTFDVKNLLNDDSEEVSLFNTLADDLQTPERAILVGAEVRF